MSAKSEKIHLNVYAKKNKQPFRVMIFIKHLHTFFIMLDLKHEEYVGFVLFELKIGKIHGCDRFRCDAKKYRYRSCFCLQKSALNHYCYYE